MGLLDDAGRQAGGYFSFSFAGGRPYSEVAEDEVSSACDLSIRSVDDAGPVMDSFRGEGVFRHKGKIIFSPLGAASINV